MAREIRRVIENKKYLQQTQPAFVTYLVEDALPIMPQVKIIAY